MGINGKRADVKFWAKNSKKDIFRLTVLVILFFMLMFGQTAIERLYVAGIINQSINPNSIQGVISVIQLLVAISMVMICATGYKVAVIAITIDLLIVGGRAITLRSLGMLPGVAMLMCELVVVSVLYSFLKKLKTSEDEIVRLAYCDVLTDIPNRRAIIEAIDNLTQQDKNGLHFAVINIDLDNFKNINDTLGHDSGDKILLTVVERWTGIMNENDYLARLGGDEFAMIIADYGSIDALKHHLSEFVELMAQPFTLCGMDCYMSASYGVALYPEDSNETGLLMKYSDIALYDAKTQGRDKICFYDSSMNSRATNNTRIVSEVHKAIDEDRVIAYYQPQYDVSNKNIRGFEALVRIIDEDGKLVNPGNFIPIAEQSSLIIEIDRCVMRCALNDFKPIVALHRDMMISVNISAVHLRDECFLSDIETILAETGFPAQNLEIELTESVFVDFLDKAVEILDKLKKMGISLAIDDFGTGYSSLSYMRRLPFNVLKIDKAFVDKLASGRKDRAFVEAIISMAKVFKFEIVSEGVETQEQYDILKKLGCDYIQGFLLGRPTDYRKAKELLV